MTCSVIIVTLNRPECVRRCIENLRDQVPSVSQVIVVDASGDSRTQWECNRFPEVLYLRHEFGEGHTTHARNLGLKHSFGEIIAFLDDDAYARSGWLASLFETYGEDSTVGAVGGRALRNTQNEQSEGCDQIGMLTKFGALSGNFGADPGKIIEVDHLIGCNMSFRREVLGRLGGFRAGFETRYCIREESDIFLIMRKLGYRILFNPSAVVDHVGAAKPTGKRFDVSWDYFGHRNHYVLLMRNFGILAPIVLLHLVSSLCGALAIFARDVSKAIVRLGAVAFGTLNGLFVGVYYTIKQGADPVRRDSVGSEITRVLLRLGTKKSHEQTSEQHQATIGNSESIA